MGVSPGENINRPGARLVGVSPGKRIVARMTGVSLGETDNMYQCVLTIMIM